MANYKILSPHYDSSVSHTSRAKIDANEHRSMLNFPPNANLLSTGAVRFYVQDGKIIGETSGNRFNTSVPDYIGHKYFSQVDDGVGRAASKFPTMDSWIANGTENPPAKSDYIPRISDVTNGYLDGILHIKGASPLRLWLPDKNDTAVNLYTSPRLVEAVDINSVGRMESKIENFRQKIRSNVLFNDTNQLHYDIAKWVEFLENEGFHPVKNPVYGIGVGKLKGLAAYLPENRYLLSDFNFHERAKHWIAEYGLKDSEALEAIERYGILHEIAHAYGVKGGRSGEGLQGRLQSKFFAKLAGELKGTKHQRIYEALSKIGDDYAKSYSLSNALLRSFENIQGNGDDIPFSAFEHKFYHEGEALGIEGKALEKYVELRVKDTFKVLIKDEDTGHSPESAQGLEQIIESPGIESNAKGVRAAEYNSSAPAGRVYLNSKESGKGKEKGKPKNYDVKHGEYEAKSSKVVSITSKAKPAESGTKDADSKKVAAASDADQNSEATADSSAEAA